MDCELELSAAERLDAETWDWRGTMRKSIDEGFDRYGDVSGGCLVDLIASESMV